MNIDEIKGDENRIKLHNFYFEAFLIFSVVIIGIILLS